MQFKNAEYIASFYNINDIPNTGYPEIAFAGRSNVGKSSLINKVLNRKRLAQVSKTPGKTRALNYFEIDRKYYFVDLPGFGFAKISQKERKSWGKLIESYLNNSANLVGLVHIIDSRRGLTDLDRMLIDFLQASLMRSSRKLHILWVLSKADKIGKKIRTEVYTKVLQELDCDPYQLVFFSILSGQGVVEVRKNIMEMLSQ
jgi:GTP-binding protein